MQAIEAQPNDPMRTACAPLGYVARAAGVLLLLTLTGCMSTVYTPGEGEEPYVRPPNRRWAMQVTSWQSLKTANVVMQQEDYSCGAACLATIGRYYWGDPVTEQMFLDILIKNLDTEELRDRLANGLSMTDLRLTAVDYGYVSTIARVSLSQLRASTIPVIVRIEVRGFEHFVVVRGFIGDEVVIADPIRGNLNVPVDEFLQQWTDGAILIVAKRNAGPQPNAPLNVDRRDPGYDLEVEAARRYVF